MNSTPKDQPTRPKRTFRYISSTLKMEEKPILPTTKQQEKTLRLCQEETGDIPFLSFRDILLKNETAGINLQEEYLKKHSTITAPHIEILVDWMNEVVVSYKYEMSTFLLAVYILHAFLHKTKTSIYLNKLQMYGIACLALASKYNERYDNYITVPEAVMSCQNIFQQADFVAAELEVLTTLGFYLGIITPSHFLATWVEANPFQREIADLAELLLSLAATDGKMSSFLPSILAVTAIYIANKFIEKQPLISPLTECQQWMISSIVSRLKKDMFYERDATYQFTTYSKLMTLKELKQFVFSIE
jgi:hypothetical protein